MKRIYITEEERKKCHKVSEAFTELYEIDNMIALDAGKYGFAVLIHYSEQFGFDEVLTFWDSAGLFGYLWDCWLEYQLYNLTRGTPTAESKYEEMFAGLSLEKQRELLEKKKEFAKRAEIE